MENKEIQFEVGSLHGEQGGDSPLFFISIWVTTTMKDDCYLHSSLRGYGRYECGHGVGAHVDI